ncbi:unnamed protein product [Durusdinium trenchii]
MVMQLQEELRAYMFLFVEVACVGHMAPACLQMRNCLWNDAAFWKAYAGVCFDQPPESMAAAALREAFRRWLFQLEDRWAVEFEEVITQDSSSEFGANYLQLFKDARYIASGLMPSDSSPQVASFAKLSASMLSQYNPKQLDERWAAESLISKVEQRSDVFTTEQIRQITNAFEESLENSFLQQHLEADDGQFAEPLPEGVWQTWELEEDDSEESFANMDFSDWAELDPSETAPALR